MENCTGAILSTKHSDGKERLSQICFPLSSEDEINYWDFERYPKDHPLSVAPAFYVDSFSELASDLTHTQQSMGRYYREAITNDNSVFNKNWDLERGPRYRDQGILFSPGVYHLGNVPEYRDNPPEKWPYKLLALLLAPSTLLALPDNVFHLMFYTPLSIGAFDPLITLYQNLAVRYKYFSYINPLFRPITNTWTVSLNQPKWKKEKEKIIDYSRGKQPAILQRDRSWRLPKKEC